MPRMDGIALLKKVKEKNISIPPVTVVSAYLDQTAIEKCIKLGAKCLLTKPVQSQDIEKVINIIISNPEEEIAKELEENLPGLRILYNDKKDIVIVNISSAHEFSIKTKILFLGANPTATARLKLDEEVKKIQTSLRLAKERENLELKQEWAVSVDSLMQAMLEELPNIIHFSGHGKEKGIILQNENGEPKTITAEALASLFKLFQDSIKCVVLNSCYSQRQAKAIKQYVPYVIAMKTGVSDQASILFSSGFYKAIGAGRDIPFAFELGKTAIQLEGIPGDNIPILL